MKNGQSLVELLLAIALLAVILPGILVGFFATRGGRATQDQRQQATACLYDSGGDARNQSEWMVKFINRISSDTSWNSWSLASSSELIDNNFTRQIVISDIYRRRKWRCCFSGRNELILR